MRRNKRPDLLVIVALFVGIGLVATALLQNALNVKPHAVNLEPSHSVSTASLNGNTR